MLLFISLKNEIVYTGLYILLHFFWNIPSCLNSCTIFIKIYMIFHVDIISIGDSEDISGKNIGNVNIYIVIFHANEIDVQIDIYCDLYLCVLES